MFSKKCTEVIVCVSFSFVSFLKAVEVKVSFTFQQRIAFQLKLSRIQLFEKKP